MSCVRFETEGLLAFERGDALDPHFDACPDCAAAKGKYDWLRAGLASADEGIEAPPNFEARVWARIDLQAPAKTAPLWARAWAWLARLVPARRAPVWAGLASVFAAGIAAVFWVTQLIPGRQEPPAPGVSGPPSLTGEILAGAGRDRNGGDVRRGDAPHPGKIMRLAGATGTSKYAELRVYRAENLVLSCSDKPPCRREGDRIEAEAPIKAPGRHELVLLLADAPLPASQGRFDADMDAAARAGAQILTAAPVEAY